MDKRIVRTKRHLRDTLFAMLQNTPFEKINVSAICTRASVSRNTFYTYYGDKYELLEDCFEEVDSKRRERFAQVIEKAAHSEEPYFLYDSLIDSILDTCHEFFGFVRPTTDYEEFIFFYYRYLERQMEEFIREHEQVIKPKYPIRQLSAFLTTGVMSFAYLGETHAESWEKNKALCHDLIRDLIDSNIFDMKIG